MAERVNKETAIVELLWDSLKRDPEHKDRRVTGWGTKTKAGLVASLDRIYEEGFSRINAHPFKASDINPDTCCVCGKYESYAPMHGGANGT